MSDMHPQGEVPDTGSVPPGHEGTDLSLKPIIAFVLGLMALAVIVPLVLSIFMTRFKAESIAAKEQIPPLFKDARGQYPPPNTPVGPRAELAKHREREQEISMTYGWTDQDAGIARVPIDRAVEILAERGLPKVKNIAPSGARGSEKP